MKCLAFAAGIAALALPLSPLQAKVIALRSGSAQACFEASQAQAPTFENFAVCDRALADGSLDAHDEVATYVNRGILHYFRGDLAAAHRDYDKALSLDPNLAQAWLNKGMAALAAGDDRQARSMFEKALALDLDRPALAYFGRAMVNEDSGNLRQAYSDLVKARQLEPTWAAPAEELKRYVVK